MQDTDLPFHDFGGIDTFKLLKTNAGLGWKGLSVHTARMGPFSRKFPGINALCISMVIEGRICGTLRFDGTTRKLDEHPGTSLIVPMRHPFEANIESYAKIISIYIRQEIIEKTLTKFSMAHDSELKFVTLAVGVDQLLEQLLLYIRILAEKEAPSSGLQVEHLAQALAMRVVYNYSTLDKQLSETARGLPSSVLEHVTSLIDKNIFRKISVERLARESGVGVAQFARLFKETVGATPYQYIIHRRVERAKYLLAETEMPIVEIAQECGFCDQVHLTRFFGRIAGSSPASYRRLTQARPSVEVTNEAAIGGS